MIQITVKPQIHLFSSSREFAEAFGLCGDDLVISNEYIYQPFFGNMNLPVQTLFQERYGAGEPTDLMAEAIMAEVEQLGCKRIIAIGGGTVIDIAKTLAVSSGGTVDALYDRAPALVKRRELVILPTTCGTGSEVTNISILNRTRIGTKMGLVAEAMYADHAVLVPQLLEKLPFGIFATSSIDALVHAVESALSPNATEYTRLFSYKAIEIILRGYQTIASEGPDARYRLLGQFLIASNYAGLAFGTAGCAAVHATSYPLGGKYHVAHGESNYALFTGVLKRYMALKSDGEIAVLNRYLQDLLGCCSGNVYDALEALLGQILPKKRLREYGVTERDLKAFAHTVMTTQQRLMKNNFVALDESQILKVYMDLY